MLTLVHAIAFDLIGLGGTEKKGAGMRGEELNSKLKKSTGSGEREGPKVEGTERNRKIKIQRARTVCNVS